MRKQNPRLPPSRREVVAAGAAALAGVGTVALPRHASAQAVNTGSGGNRFRFVFMPDLHLRREFGSAEGVARALKAAMALGPKPAFVVTGRDQWRGPDVDTEEGFAVIDCRPDGTFDYRYHEYGWDAWK